MRALLIFVLLFIAVSMADEKRPKDPEPAKSQNNSTTPSGQSAQSVAPIIQIQAQVHASAPQEATKKGDGPTGNDSTTFAAWASALAAFFAFVAAAFQAWYARRQVKIAASALTASENAVMAAEESAKVARISARTAHISERPYLIPEYSGGILGADTNRLRYVQWGFRNAGKTVGIVLRFQDALICQHKDVPINPERIFGKPLSNKETGYTPVAPGESAAGIYETIRANLSMLLTEPESVPRADWRYILIGRFEYEDIFGAKWVQGFCWKLFPSDDSATKEGSIDVRIIRSGGAELNYERQIQEPKTE
jgi:hypothetical protein